MFFYKGEPCICFFQFKEDLMKFKLVKIRSGSKSKSLLNIKNMKNFCLHRTFYQE